VTAWYENDDFWAAMEPALFDPMRMEAADDEVESLLALVGVDEPLKVLDLCCGPARHGVALAQRGHEVTGVDRTRLYLERAKAAAQEAEVSLELVEDDMRTFRREGAFDLAINLFTSFGYFSDEENLRVAENLRASLKSDGVLVMEMIGKEILAGGFQPRRWFEANGAILLEQPRITDGWERIENRWTIIKDGERFEHDHNHRLYSGVELRRVLWDAGFEHVELYGSLEGAPYDLEAERLVAVAFPEGP
jgi:SAM-dependent methyltransferase